MVSLEDQKKEEGKKKQIKDEGSMEHELAVAEFTEQTCCIFFILQHNKSKKQDTAKGTQK
eukprot:NODE_2969_length_720_cov_219.867362_g2096_i0.p2 GENE.NODE_2969_length_720_cov_219.867362_g2096_i0~~NODE_2969_length_720_cov_219.867362_g2096_i0.p2  ORF type:complete len:60 (+),score=4.55 NODE_2969_length_720_cov_219.867362_g2096_i0:284-463(+)